MTLDLLEVFIRVYGSREGTRLYLDTMRMQGRAQSQAQTQAEAQAEAQRQAEKQARHAWAYGMGADRMRAQASQQNYWRNRAHEAMDQFRSQQAAQANAHRYGWTEYHSDGSTTNVTMTIDAEPGSYEWKD